MRALRLREGSSWSKDTQPVKGWGEIQIQVQLRGLGKLSLGYFYLSLWGFKDLVQIIVRTL